MALSFSAINVVPVCTASVSYSNFFVFLSRWFRAPTETVDFLIHETHPVKEVFVKNAVINDIYFRD